jgi:hypothetical protein
MLVVVGGVVYWLGHVIGSRHGGDSSVWFLGALVAMGGGFLLFAGLVNFGWARRYGKKRGVEGEEPERDDGE